MFKLINSRDGRNLDVMLGGDLQSKIALVCHHGTPSDASLWQGWDEQAAKKKCAHKINYGVSAIY